MTERYWDPSADAAEHEDLDHLRDHFDPVCPGLTRGRYGRVAGRMAQECPITRTDGFESGIWTVSGYDALLEVHKREGTELSNFPVLLQNFGNVRPVIPMESDPPLHRQYKQIIAEPLSRAAQKEKEPYYREIVRDLLAPVLERGSCDLFTEICNPLAVHALMDALGVPGPDRDRLAELAVSLVRGRAGDGRAAEEIYAYFDGLSAKKRRDPADDIVSRLCSATVDGRPLTETEILDYCMILLPAGFETTASSMSMMFLVLAEEPELQRSLRDDPSSIPTALDELMRYVTPTRSHTRTVTAPFSLGAHDFAVGDRIYLNWAGANHDPAVFDRPDEIVPDRRPNRHMAYGFGAHLCVGVHMARTEMRIAFEEVLAAMGDIRVADPDAVVEQVGTTWAITTLPVEFTVLRRGPVTGR
ncbi:cytochrome P450 [Pseudonocardia endophytica]|uniref:Cytochrome P450 n=1 Tax=Pseudonocardia endophytica TaxID=401976 RepID=A0A4R1I572_PSEEN|nr:cytochrome P450 [Pseudonocardia endophytica]TCK25172.1 cytochrome P450 [Pseudonocardia endophytica]